MSGSAEKLKSQISALSVQDRAELAHFLIRSLDDSEDADAEGAWEGELDRRLDEIKNGGAAGEPADSVFAELRAKYA